jgi:hypothetical protein
VTDSQKSKSDASRQVEPEPGEGKKALNPMQVVSSVLAAGLGVQSSKNRERDFKQGRFGVFVAAGIIFTLVFMGTIYTVVQLVLKGAGH